ncbi:hypothetical protein A4A49_64005, partial [Nicotiana attenuata]
LTWTRQKLGQGGARAAAASGVCGKIIAAGCGQDIGAEQCQIEPSLGTKQALGRSRFVAVERRPVADFVVLFENMAGGTNAELRQRVEQLEALVGQAVEVDGDSSVLARMARLEEDYAARHETMLAEMALAREWKKSGKGQTTEDEGHNKNVRQEIHNDKERIGKFKGCFTCGGPHFKKDCPVQARVNAMLAAKKQEQVAEANALVADVNGAPGALFVNNPLG